MFFNLFIIIFPKVLYFAIQNQSGEKIHLSKLPALSKMAMSIFVIILVIVLIIRRAF